MKKKLLMALLVGVLAVPSSVSCFAAESTDAAAADSDEEEETEETEAEDKDRIDALVEVYNSFISSKIDDYNSSVYYENPEYIFECYREKKMI